MIEYPKIDTLWNRDESTFKVIPGQYRRPEFALIREWHVTEKIDGTNIRIHLRQDGTFGIYGRTNRAQVPPSLTAFANEIFTPDKVRTVTEKAGSDVTLYGEGYGEKIQSGGNYRSGVSFRLFDVLVGQWWLEPDAIDDVAASLMIQTVPTLGTWKDIQLGSVEELVYILNNDGDSRVAQAERGHSYRAEGIVARTVPTLFNRRGERVMWKAKFRDF